MKDYPKALFKDKKTMWHLLDFDILNSMAEEMTKGAIKHTNYEDGTVDETEYQDKIMRHFYQYLNGELDEDSGKNPLIHLMCDAMVLLSFISDKKDAVNEPNHECSISNSKNINTCYNCEFNKNGICEINKCYVYQITSCSGNIKKGE